MKTLALLLLFVAAISNAESPKGRLCKGHPVLGLLEPDFKPEIIRSWEFTPIMSERMYWRRSFYQPRDSRHRYIPVSDIAVATGQTTLCDYSARIVPVDDRYLGLDVFVTKFDKSNRKDWATLHFQRPAKVYLFVDAYWHDYKTLTPASLPGWHSEGWAKETSGNHRAHIPYGVEQPEQHVRFKKRMGHMVYIFSNAGNVSDSVVLPSKRWVKNNIEGFRVPGKYHVRVAEQNGKPVTKPALPYAWEDIPAGGRCTEELHDEWMAPSKDETGDIVNSFGELGYRTYHPQWDPCYFCAYDHEHGSDPKTLMGYEPKFSYTALRNNEDESHTGFKGHVLDLGNNTFMYFQVHAEVSNMRRYDARLHTMVVAVTRKDEEQPGGFKLLMEVSHKADFGFACGKERGGKDCLALTSDDKDIKNDGVIAHREMNVLNVDNIDKAFRINEKRMLRGRNEHWRMGKQVLCMGTKKGRIGKMEIHDPSTATRFRNKTEVEDGRFIHELVWLGKMDSETGEYKWRNTATNRDVKFNNARVGLKYCDSYVNPSSGTRDSSVFYTNPKGTKFVNESAPNAVKQFVNKDLDLHLKGKWKAVDNWVGLYKKGHRGHMRNIGNAINPFVN